MKRLKGFTLIEMMIAVAIIAILAAIAYPSYLDYVRQGRRTEAISTLLDLQQKQETWRTRNATYAAAGASGLTVPTSNYYKFDIADNTGTTYTLKATPKGSQAADKVGGVVCDLSINQDNNKLPTECWKK